MIGDALTKHEHVQSGPDAVRMLRERLRQHRLKRNWSQAEMARRAHLSRAAYQNFETGSGNLTLRNLMKILWVLGLAHHLAQMVPPLPVEPAPAPSTKPARQRSYMCRIPPVKPGHHPRATDS
jgi:DNA-binding XRE family transcriptional regulator